MCQISACYEILRHNTQVCPRQKKNVVGYVLGVLMHGETTKLGNEDSELNPVNYYSTSTNLHTIIMIILSLYHHY